MLSMTSKEQVFKVGLGAKWNAVKFLRITYTEVNEPYYYDEGKYYFSVNHVMAHFLGIWQNISVPVSKDLNLSFGLSSLLMLSNNARNDYIYQYYEAYDGIVNFGRELNRYPTNRKMEEDIIRYHLLSFYFGMCFTIP